MEGCFVGRFVGQAFSIAQQNFIVMLFCHTFDPYLNITASAILPFYNSNNVVNVENVFFCGPSKNIKALTLLWNNFVIFIQDFPFEID